MLADTQTTTAPAAEKAVADADRALSAVSHPADQYGSDPSEWGAALREYEQTREALDAFKDVDTEGGISEAHQDAISRHNGAVFDLFDEPAPHWSAVGHKLTVLMEKFCWDEKDADQRAFVEAVQPLYTATMKAGDRPFAEVQPELALNFSQMVYDFASAAGRYLYPQYAINRWGMADLVACVGSIQDASKEASAAFSKRAAEMDLDLALYGFELDRRSELEAAVSEKVDATDGDLDAAVACTGEVARKIMECDASTLEGYRVKAKAIRWASGGDDESLYSAFAANGSTTNQFAYRMLTDLLGAERWDAERYAAAQAERKARAQAAV